MNHGGLQKPQRLSLVPSLEPPGDEPLDVDRDLPPLSEALRCELDRRVALLDANPDAVTPWADVKARILARLKQ